MKTKEQIINDMYEYSLLKISNNTLESGMTPQEKEFLYSQMQQLFNHNFESYLNSIHNIKIILNKNF